MKRLIVVALLLSAGMVLAQDGNSDNSAKQANRPSKDQVTMRGCVSMSSGDYILMKTDPDVSYELQATGKTHLRHYLGRQVEVTAHEEPTLSSSSDALNKVGSAAPLTLTIISIKVIDRHCATN
jgi:hypothetical protein